MLYALYLDTFMHAQTALQAGDEARMRACCREVAARDGVASTVSLLALGDAEHMRTPRTRSAMYWLIRHHDEPRPAARP